MSLLSTYFVLGRVRLVYIGVLGRQKTLRVSLKTHQTCDCLGKKLEPKNWSWSWVRIPAPSTGWIFFTLIFYKNSIVACLKKTENKRKRGRVGPFLKTDEWHKEGTISKLLILELNCCNIACKKQGRDSRSSGQHPCLKVPIRIPLYSTFVPQNADCGLNSTKTNKKADAHKKWFIFLIIFVL